VAQQFDDDWRTALIVAGRMSRGALQYKVLLLTAGWAIVVDDAGKEVPGACVSRIEFPPSSYRSHEAYDLSGPGEAVIEVCGQTFTGVPIC
jgi:hypothetical protein